MTHSWSEWLGSVLDSPDPVQAYFNSTGVFTLGCVDSSCSADCTNISAIASSVFPLQPLWGCALYPNVTNDFRLGSLSAAQKSTVTADGVDTSVAKAATVTSTLSSCLSAWCESLDECKQHDPDICSASSLSINGTMLSLGAVDTCMLAICESGPSPLTNADIAGVGQVLSYIIQIGIVLLSALVLLVLRSWRKLDHTSYDRLPRQATESQTSMELKNFKATATKHRGLGMDVHVGLHHEAASDAQKLDTFSVSNIHDALIMALVDFLKSQCFVAIAASIAALITLNSGAQTTVLDAAALGAASGVSIIPTAFNYYVLATFNPRRKSWYLYGLALCSWIMGFSVVFSRQMLAENIANRTVDDYNLALFGSRYPNACGNAAPISICPEVPYPNVHPEFAFYYTLCLPVMIGLTIWQLSSVPPISKFLSRCFYRDSKENSALFSLLHLAALCFLVVPLAFFFMSLRDLFWWKAINFEWSFGQIVALTLWLPSATGFVNSLLHGVEDAHTNQLPERYSTRRTNDH